MVDVKTTITFDTLDPNSTQLCPLCLLCGEDQHVQASNFSAHMQKHWALEEMAHNQVGGAISSSGTTYVNKLESVYRNPVAPPTTHMQFFKDTNVSAAMPTDTQATTQQIKEVQVMTISEPQPQSPLCADNKGIFGDNGPIICKFGSCACALAPMLPPATPPMAVTPAPPSELTAASSAGVPLHDTKRDSGHKHRTPEERAKKHAEDRAARHERREADRRARMQRPGTSFEFPPGVLLRAGSSADVGAPMNTSVVLPADPRSGGLDHRTNSTETNTLLSHPPHPPTGPATQETECMCIIASNQR